MSEERKWEEIAAKLNNEEFDADFLPQDKDEYNKIAEADRLLKANRKVLVELQKTKTTAAWYRFEARKGKQTRKHFIYRLVGAAAAAFILISSGYFLNTLVNHEPVQAESLTTLSIPNAEMGNIQLADGTKVYLNSGTELKYKDSFKGKREVFLDGEAYFEVKSDKTNPFFIHLNDFTIKVTGTKFNVKSYADCNPETSLMEGKISILNTRGSELLDLKPNETLVLDKSTRKMYVSETPAQRCDWRNGELFLKNKPLSEITQTLERWYDVKFEFADENVKSIRLTGTILKNKPIEQILEVLKISEPLHYTYEYQEQRLVKIKVDYQKKRS